MYTCIHDYVYMQGNYVYMQDDYVYMQGNYVHVYIIRWYFFHSSQNLYGVMKKIMSWCPFRATVVRTSYHKILLSFEAISSVIRTNTLIWRHCSAMRLDY